MTHFVHTHPTRREGRYYTCPLCTWQAVATPWGAKVIRPGDRSVLHSGGALEATEADEVRLLPAIEDYLRNLPWA